MKDKQMEVGEKIQQIGSEHKDCPAPEELASYLAEELPEDRFLSLEVHVHNCVRCARVVERFRNPDKISTFDRSYRGKQQKDVNLVAERLGFREKGGLTALSRMFDWLWRVNIPLYVPVGVSVALLCLIAYFGIPPTDLPRPSMEYFGEARFIGLEQSASRAASAEREPKHVVAGDLVMIDYRVDEPGYLPGDPVQCMVTDSEGNSNRIDTAIGTNYTILIPLRFSAPGSYVMHLHHKGSETPFDSFMIVAESAGNAAAQP